MQWRESVWAAVQRQAKANHGRISRDQLITHELPVVVQETASKGKTPTQTLSRVLQELRDSGVLIFERNGEYRLSSLTAQEPDLAAAIRTQTQALVHVRIGQSYFRMQLLRRWQFQCPLTGICEPALLRASHIVPWRACATEAERINPDNGLILSALWDAAFDDGLISFAADGSAIAYPRLGQAAKATLMSGRTPVLSQLTPGNLQRPEVHRAYCATGEWPVRPA